MILHITEQQTLPRIEKGIDYGIKRNVLAVHGSLKLVWIPGHSAWQDRLTGYAYKHGLLVVIDTEKTNPSNTKYVTHSHYADDERPYRLSKATLEYYAREISVYMDIPAEYVPQLYKRGKTIIINDPPTESKGARTMSTEIETKMTTHTATEFWGGDNRGVCLRITATDSVKICDTVPQQMQEEGHIQLTMEEAASLCNTLNAFVRREAMRRQELFKAEIEKLKIAEETVFHEVARIPSELVTGHDLAVQMVSAFCPKAPAADLIG